MKRLTSAYIAILTAALALTSCHSIPEYENTGKGNFEQLWTLFDEHYCFFEESGVDWDSVYRAYAPRVESCRTQRELFRLCADMVNELRDGHVNLTSPFATSYYKKWWSDYPQNYNQRIVEENYLYFGGQQIGTVTYAVLPQNIGYISIPTFSSGIGEGNLDYIINYMALCDGLIIDVRDNGGGSIDNVETWVSRFITERTLAGSICHKTGKGHNDFSEPYEYYFEPPSGHLLWGKPVALLTNRSTFSAANNFVSIMRLLPNVTQIGDTTGGGCGMPLSFDLPIGWTVRMSACPVYDPQGRLTEFGLPPHIPVSQTPADLAASRDPILDTAIAHLTHNTAPILP